MSNDEREIRELVATWMSASQSGDLETVLGLITDDVVFLVPGQEPFGKEKFSAASKSTAGVKMEGASDIIELQVRGDWAWMRNRLSVRVTSPGGQVMKRAGYTLTILCKNTEGKWQIARDANLLSSKALN